MASVVAVRPAAARDYLVRLADLQRDREAILDVWTRCFPNHDRAYHAARFDWYYIQNPAGAARCWVLIQQDQGQIVGTAGVGPRRLRCGQRSYGAGLTSDFAVDQAYRSVQPALLLQKAVIASMGREFDVLYGLPNARSMGIFQRLGYRKGGDLQRFVKVFRVERYLSAHPWLRRAGKWLAPPIDFARRLTARETWQKHGDARLVELADFDARFEELGHRAAAPDTLLAERTLSYLRWRYQRCPLQRYRTLAWLSECQDRLLGYAVSYVGTDEQLRVVDWIVDREVRDPAPFLSGFLRWSRGSGAAAVTWEGFGLEGLPALLRRFGFVSRAPLATVMAYPAAASDTTSDLGRWYFLRGDEDYN